MAINVSVQSKTKQIRGAKNRQKTYQYRIKKIYMSRIFSDGKSVEPMKFREQVPIRTGPHSPKEKEKNKLATTVSSSAAAAAEAAARTHTDIDMSHSTPEQSTFGENDESDALPSDAIAAAELDDLRDRRVMLLV